MYNINVTLYFKLCVKSQRVCCELTHFCTAQSNYFTQNNCELNLPCDTVLINGDSSVGFYLSLIFLVVDETIIANEPLLVAE